MKTHRPGSRDGGRVGSCTPSMGADLEVEVLREPGHGDSREPQGRDREGASEGSGERRGRASEVHAGKGGARAGEQGEAGRYDAARKLRRRRTNHEHRWAVEAHRQPFAAAGGGRRVDAGDQDFGASGESPRSATPYRVCRSLPRRLIGEPSRAPEHERRIFQGPSRRASLVGVSQLSSMVAGRQALARAGRGGCLESRSVALRGRASQGYRDIQTCLLCVMRSDEAGGMG